MTRGIYFYNPTTTPKETPYKLSLCLEVCCIRNQSQLGPYLLSFEKYSTQTMD
jgi:hypothetical protein